MSDTLKNLLHVLAHPETSDQEKQSERANMPLYSASSRRAVSPLNLNGMSMNALQAPTAVQPSSMQVTHVFTCGCSKVQTAVSSGSEVTVFHDGPCTASALSLIHI